MQSLIFQLIDKTQQNTDILLKTSIIFKHIENRNFNQQLIFKKIALESYFIQSKNTFIKPTAAIRSC